MMSRLTRATLHQPHVAMRLQRGIHTLAAALQPTLGPIPRVVAVAASSGTRAPELLDDGGLIARRMLQLPDRDEDVGAMLLRDTLLHVHEVVGDGVATTSVIFKSVFDDGLREIAAGCNAMRLRDYLQDGLNLVLASLEEATVDARRGTTMRQVAATVCSDSDLAAHLAEIFEVIGEYGQIAFRSGQIGELSHDILEGAYWDTVLLSRTQMAERAVRRVESHRPAIFLSDLEIDQPQDLVPLVRQARASGANSLVVVARRLKDSCLGFLAANASADFPILPVQTPEGARAQYQEPLEDLAVLTGARAFHAASGDSAANLRPGDLGRSRRAWADQTRFGIIGPGGAPRRWQAQVHTLRQAERGCNDPAVRTRLVERIARLTGASAMLWVSGASKSEIETRKALALRTTTALRSTLREGALPGAGVALLACLPQLEVRLADASDDDQRAAYRVLLSAVKAPTRALAENAGYDPSEVEFALEDAPPGHGWDARTGRLVDVVQAGIVDPSAVVRMAVRAGVGGASQALTIDTLVHPKEPELVIRK